MATLPPSVRVLCLAVAALAVPTPGRIPKVYNALITSNQNLEPSKAYPVYQPVLHDTFAFPFQPAVFYGDYPYSSGFVPSAPIPPKEPSTPKEASSPPEHPAEEKPSPPAGPPASPPASPKDEAHADDKTATPAPPLPPNTQSPIPLNEFGLPPQVLPLGRVDPAYSGFNQVGPFTYSYNSFRFYDPFDPFSYSYNPYTGLGPLYRPLPNVIEHRVPEVGVKKESPAKPESSDGKDDNSPPPEPSDLNLLNNASKDPAIPNVPPPPLPDGGLKSDNPE